MRVLARRVWLRIERGELAVSLVLSGFGLYAVLQAQGGTLEVLHAEGLQQIVYRVHLESLDGIFGIGCGEDDERGHGERLHKVHTVQVGHVDVAEDGIYRVLFQKLFCLDGALALCRQLQKGYFAYVGCNLLKSQRLIVYGHASDHVSGMISSTLYMSGSSCMFSVKLLS